MIRMLDENIYDISGCNRVSAELQHNEPPTNEIGSNEASKLGFESETIPKKTKTILNKNRSKRKRDNPSVMADDDLIRNWCQMKCTKCPELFNGCTFKDVKVHYSKEHEMNGFLLCCEKKFFRRVRALEHIARHINPSVFR